MASRGRATRDHRSKVYHKQPSLKKVKCLMQGIETSATRREDVHESVGLLSNALL